MDRSTAEGTGRPARCTARLSEATRASYSRQRGRDSSGGINGTIERVRCFCSEPGKAKRVLSKMPYRA